MTHGPVNYRNSSLMLSCCGCLYFVLWCCFQGLRFVCIDLVERWIAIVFVFIVYYSVGYRLLELLCQQHVSLNVVRQSCQWVLETLGYFCSAQRDSSFFFSKKTKWLSVLMPCWDPLLSIIRGMKWMDVSCIDNGFKCIEEIREVAMHLSYLYTLTVLYSLHSLH